MRRLRWRRPPAGELTLRGLVLPVGGIKEKLLAAHTAGLARVVVPARNMRDVEVRCAVLRCSHAMPYHAVLC